MAGGAGHPPPPTSTPCPTLHPSSPAAAAAADNPPTLPFRGGHGFDLHRLEEGPYKLILGGVEIPHDRGCVAHSDGKGEIGGRGGGGKGRAGEGGGSGVEYGWMEGLPASWAGTALGQRVPSSEGFLVPSRPSRPTLHPPTPAQLFPLSPTTLPNHPPQPPTQNLAVVPENLLVFCFGRKHHFFFFIGFFLVPVVVAEWLV